MLLARGIISYSSLQQVEEVVRGYRQVAVFVRAVEEDVGEMLCESAMTGPPLPFTRKLSRPARKDCKNTRSAGCQLVESLGKRL